MHPTWRAPPSPPFPLLQAPLFSLFVPVIPFRPSPSPSLFPPPPTHPPKTSIHLTNYLTYSTSPYLGSDFPGIASTNFLTSPPQPTAHSPPLPNCRPNASASPLLSGIGQRHHTTTHAGIYFFGIALPSLVWSPVACDSKSVTLPDSELLRQGIEERKEGRKEGRQTNKQKELGN